MPPLDAEKEERYHNDIISFLILNSIYRNVRKIDTASEDTIALLREKVEGVLELYGEKHPVKTSFTNALATLFMALLVPGMPFETTEVERIVRDIVMVYKRLHRQIQCQEGADHASIEMTFDAMCKKRGIPPPEALLRILRDPTWRPFKGRPGTGVSIPALTH